MSANKLLPGKYVLFENKLNDQLYVGQVTCKYAYIYTKVGRVFFLFCFFFKFRPVNEVKDNEIGH